MEIHELNPLFEDVQMQKVFADGKTFVDCIPKFAAEEISRKYKEEKEKTGFVLKDFILENFELPVAPIASHVTDQTKPVEENIEQLWKILTRQPDKIIKGGSLIPLPHPYIVPGGRFGEIYYWDSYFTMLGLKQSGKTGMIENMVKNFSYLIDTFGYIPNGNRSYFLGRSQPPFFSLMVRLLADLTEKEIILQYLHSLEKEYQFWMKGQHELSEKNKTEFHTVKLPGGEILNRYWDEHETPRPESFSEDVELAHRADLDNKTLYRHLRAGAESGWDYSSRWFKDEASFTSIHTTDIVPVDLNCLLFHLEQTIAEAYQLKNDRKASEQFQLLSEQRSNSIQRYCWNTELDFFVDYDLEAGKQKQALTLAGVAPLFFKVCSKEQAEKTVLLIKEKFLQAGGVVTTLKNTRQQWDAPNGWAPLQWMTITGLENYGFTELAREIASRWITLNEKVFAQTGKMMEKYDVMNMDKLAGGGEYPGQDGFGWTNGVLLALLKKFGKPG